MTGTVCIYTFYTQSGVWPAPCLGSHQDQTINTEYTDTPEWAEYDFLDITRVHHRTEAPIIIKSLQWLDCGSVDMYSYV